MVVDSEVFANHLPEPSYVQSYSAIGSWTDCKREERKSQKLCRVNIVAMCQVKCKCNTLEAAQIARADGVHPGQE